MTTQRIVDIAKGLPDASEYIDPELTTVADIYVQDDRNFVARQVFPSVPVQIQTGKYWSYSKADFNRDEMQERADGDQVAETGFRQAERDYAAKVWSLGHRVGPQRLTNNPRAPQVAAKFLSRKALIKDEVLWAAAFWGAGKWTTERQGAASPTGGQVLTWRDTDADPLEQIEEAIDEAELLAAGMDFNRMVFSKDAWTVFKNHPNVLARFNNGQTSGGAKVTVQGLQELLGIERIIIAKAPRTTSGPLVAEEDSTYARILSTGVGLFHAAPAPSVDTPSAGYHFDWTGYTGAVAGGVGTAIFEEPIPLTGGARLYSIEHATQAKLVAADLGIFFYDILTAAA